MRRRPPPLHGRQGGRIVTPATGDLDHVLHRLREPGQRGHDQLGGDGGTVAHGWIHVEAVERDRMRAALRPPPQCPSHDLAVLLSDPRPFRPVHVLGQFGQVTVGGDPPNGLGHDPRGHAVEVRGGGSAIGDHVPRLAKLSTMIRAGRGAPLARLQQDSSDCGSSPCGLKRISSSGGGHVPCVVRAVRNPVAPSLAPTSARRLILADTKKPPTLPFRLVEGFPMLCAPEGTRTPNLLIRSQMLYPLSYGRLCSASVHTRLSRGDSGIRTREGL